MTADPIPSPRRYSFAEYMAFEERMPNKHEFHDGEVLAMSGASPEHALITANLIRAVGNRLQGKPCRVYSSDLKIGIPPTARVLYPDGSIVCGPLEYHPADEGKRRVVTNPTVVIEVLSPSTAGYDRVEKFLQYRRIASLREYVLVSQDRAVVETFVRQGDGDWLVAGAFVGMEAVARIRAVEIDVPLAEVFAGVEFPPPEEPPEPEEYLDGVKR